MTIQDILNLNLCKPATTGDVTRKISKIFCCDLLSIAMSKAPADSVWVTVMGNKNTLAVASLADVACIILAEGIKPDESLTEKAKKEQIFVLTTDLPVFDIALRIQQDGNL